MGFLGVALGAFGAHGLKDLLDAHDRVTTWDTAVLYHLVHAGLLLLVGMLLDRQPQSRALKVATGSAIAGVVIFSGSLYVLSLSNLTWLGAITPLGGMAFLLAWGLILLHSLQNHKT